MRPRRDRDPTDAQEDRASLLGLGFAVKHFREQAGLSRAEVARRGGLTGNTITHIESGLKVEPRWDTVRRLATGLSVKLEDLVSLGIELAPGDAGESLRLREQNARVSEEKAMENRTKEAENGSASKTTAT